MSQLRAQITIWVAVVLTCLCLLLAVFLYPYRDTIVHGLFAAVLVLGALAALVALGAGVYLLCVGIMNLHAKALALQERTQALRHAEEQHQLEIHLALTRVEPDLIGNYPYLIGEHPITYAPPGNPAYAPQIVRGSAAKIVEEANAQKLLDAPAIVQPSQEWLISQLEENALQVSPGVRADTGEVVKVTITTVPHFKLLGSTGFGKSCLAGALLDQATSLNSPDVFQLALLDLEHKTSRLFEDLPHVAIVTVGKRRVSLVATTADEVAEHLGYLKRELDRRTALSELELAREPVLFIYVEEMLSLQYEVVDPKLLNRMFADLTILSVRGRKYGMFLLAVMQTDYSNEQMKVTQKMFRFRGAAAVDTTAARAAGFMNVELIKQNFQQGQPGQFVIEYPSFSNLVLAPTYDVKRLLGRHAGADDVFARRSDVELLPPLRVVNSERTPLEHGPNTARTFEEQAWQAKRDEIKALRAQGWEKIASIEKVWKVKRGESKRYQRACEEYEQLLSELDQEREA